MIEEQTLIKILWENKEYLERYKEIRNDVLLDYEEYMSLLDNLIEFYNSYNELPTVYDLLMYSEDEKYLKAVQSIDKLVVNNNQHTRDRINKYIRSIGQKKIIMDYVDKLEKNHNCNVEIEKLHKYNDFDLFDIDKQFKLMTATQFTKLDIPEREDILSPWLKDKSITLVSSWRGVGKTNFVWGLVKAISIGIDIGVWRGIENKCMILDGELVEEEIQDRLRSHRLSKNVYIKSCVYDEDRKNYPGLILNSTYRDHIKKLCIENNVKLLVLDNKKSLSGGIDENSSYQWDAVNDWLLDLRGLGISTIVVTHTGKDESKGIRGFSGIEDNVDNVILLKDKRKGSENCKFSYHFHKTRQRIPFYYTKSMTMEFTLDEDTNNYKWKVEEKDNTKYTMHDRQDYIIQNYQKIIDGEITRNELCDMFGTTKGTISKDISKVDDLLKDQ